ncbi:MAG TPA: DUF4446 family protein [Candidatus Avilachnospira avistercoris]|nr:DUF4446 family protein [Candidatus Avilachnospira avistercoris]
MSEREILIIALSAIAVLCITSLVIALIAIGRYRDLFRRYDMFMRGRDAESMEEFILKQQDDIEELKEAKLADREAMRVMNRNIRSSIQKFGLVHYDAFEGMGGKMSFALALLDYTNTGMIINCMHSREGCFIYVKEVEAGSTYTPLGAEEKEALERALGYIKD